MTVGAAGDPAAEAAEDTGAAPERWRPSLAQVTAIVLCAVALTPLVGLVFFRLVETQLVRQTESELIGQSAVFSAAIAYRLGQLPDLALGPELPAGSTTPEGYRPTRAQLDLATTKILPDRPEAAPAAPPSAALLAIGKEMMVLASTAQRTTLAGFRFLDATGRVIGGRDDLGRSYAAAEEVRSALGGQFSSVLRLRTPNRPAPPVYALSRGTRVRVFTAMPVIIDGRVAGVVYASRTPNNIVRFLYDEWRGVALAAAAMVLVTAAIGLIFVRVINRPVHRLMARAEAITQGAGADEPAPGPIGTREMARLSLALEQMAATLQRRSDYVAGFAQHVSHELKSPLAAMRGAAELMREDPHMGDAERDRLLGTIRRDADRLTALLARLRELARADMLDPGGTASLDQVVGALSRRFAGLGIEAPVPAVLPLSQESAELVIGHLADNAQRHGADRIVLHVAETAAVMDLTVTDNGSGISAGNAERVFEPFFTTRRETGGTGMGLRIVRSILETVGGEIALVAPPPEGPSGAAFRVRLRRAPGTGITIPQPGPDSGQPAEGDKIGPAERGGHKDLGQGDRSDDDQPQNDPADSAQQRPEERPGGEPALSARQQHALAQQPDGQREHGEIAEDDNGRVDSDGAGVQVGIAARGDPQRQSHEGNADQQDTAQPGEQEPHNRPEKRRLG